MSKKLLWRLMLVVSVAALFAVACGDDDDGAGGAAAPSGVKFGGTLKVGLESPIVNLDPHTMGFGWEIYGAAEHSYSGLVRADNSFAPEPDIASSWNVSADGKTFTFTLREDVKFHNGDKVDSSDVKYSLERILDPNTGAPYSGFLRPVVSIEAPDKYTIVIKTDQPYSALLANLSMPTMAVVPEKEVASRGNLKEHAVGTGPFKFVSHLPGSKLSLEKNKDYYREGLPRVDGLDILILVDPTARTSALRSGDVDLLDNVPTKDVRSLQADSNINVIGGPNVNFVGLNLNNANAPLDILKVRQAMAWGLDRQEVIDKGFDGLARPLYGTALVPPFWAGSSKLIYEGAPDYEKARQLLAEAGFPNGFKLEMLVSATSSYARPMSEIAQAEWKKIGIDAELVVKEGAAAGKDHNEGNYWTYSLRWWGADFNDPDGALRPVFACGEPKNRARYCNEQVTQFMLDAIEESDPPKRQQLYEQAMVLIAEEVGQVHIMSLDRYQAMRPYVKEYVSFPNASNQSFERVWLDR